MESIKDLSKSINKELTNIIRAKISDKEKIDVMRKILEYIKSIFANNTIENQNLLHDQLEESIDISIKNYFGDRDVLQELDKLWLEVNRISGIVEDDKVSQIRDVIGSAVGAEIQPQNAFKLFQSINREILQLSKEILKRLEIDNISDRKKLFAKIQSIISKKVYTESDPEFDSEVLIADIYREIIAELKDMIMKPGVENFKGLSSQDLLAKLVDFIFQMKQITPSIELEFYPSGGLFDRRYHQIVSPACPEEGNIVFTVYPSYRRGVELLERAKVFTEI